MSTRGYQMMGTHTIRKVPITSLQGATPLGAFAVKVSIKAKRREPNSLATGNSSQWFI